MKKILIVEDDINLGTTLAGALEMQDFQVSYLTTGEGVMEKFKTFQPDVVILDVMLNGTLDGFEIGKLIRLENKTPILFATSRDGNEDLKKGFSIYNSDYVRKPYRLMEMLLRIEKMLCSQTKEAVFQIGIFHFYPCEQSLKCNCEDIHLNNLETAVLTLLCKNMGAFVSKQTITKQVWNEKDAKLKEGSLNNILTNLRKHLQKDNDIILETRTMLGVKLMLK
jgi:two-component system, OmpR family, response regulator TrcR